MEKSNGKDLIVINRPTGPRIFPETGRPLRNHSRLRRAVRFAASFLIAGYRRSMSIIRRPNLGPIDYVAIATVIEFIPKVIRNFV